MKKSLTFALAAAALCVTGNAFAQTTASTNVRVYARIVRPITISEWEEMNFGGIYATGAAQTVTITPDNTGVYENNALRTGAALINNVVNASADLADGDGIEQGGVQVGGEAGFAYTLSTSGGSLTGPGTMPISNVKLVLSPGGTVAPAPQSYTLPGTITTPGAASQIVNVGCSITVGAAQAPGIYSGNLGMTATYN